MCGAERGKDELTTATTTTRVLLETPSAAAANIYTCCPYPVWYFFIFAAPTSRMMGLNLGVPLGVAYLVFVGVYMSSQSSDIDSYYSGGSGGASSSSPSLLASRLESSR